MQEFSKLALLAGFLGIMSIQGQSAWSSVYDDEGLCFIDEQCASSSHVAVSSLQAQTLKSPATLSAVLSGYFKYDLLESPFEDQPNSGTKFASMVAGYMKNADEETLTNLFYKSDFDTWKAVYKKVKPGKAALVCNFVTLLNKTKRKIFKAYASATEYKKRWAYLDAYFYVPILIDYALQNFASCKEVSVEQTLTNLAGLVNDNDGRFKKMAQTLLNFCQTKSCWQRGFDQRGTEQEQLGERFFSLKQALFLKEPIHQDIGSRVYKLLSQLDPQTDSENIFHYIEGVARNLNVDNHLGARLSLSRKHKEVFLDLYKQALDTLSFSQKFDRWKKLIIKRQSPYIFEVERILSRLVESFKDIEVDSMIECLQSLSPYLLDLNTDGQIAFVDALSTALGKNQCVKIDEVFKVWSLLEKILKNQEAKLTTLLHAQKEHILQKIKEKQSIKERETEYFYSSEAIVDLDFLL